ncbi:MAG: YkgJ family cysteine cluster protein [Vampirovibrionales bacterium]|nr:YkgJ family cysteine cluster protein [Vampirovibrionales bacterium]
MADMLEMITSFVCGESGGGPQTGEIQGRYTVRRGECHSCGDCCRNIYLLHDEKPIATVGDFRRLQAENPEYGSFEPLDETDHGVRFRCHHLTDENRCAQYASRPGFCRTYPSEKGVLLGGQLSPQCGYAFTPIRSFSQALADAARTTPGPSRKGRSQ